MSPLLAFLQNPSNIMQRYVKNVQFVKEKYTFCTPCSSLNALTLLSKI
jgi:hypothetical protein